MIEMPSANSTGPMVERPSNEHHDDAIVPMDKDVVSLFYTRVVMAIICTDVLPASCTGWPLLAAA